jgi:hypothetical protein
MLPASASLQETNCQPEKLSVRGYRSESRNVLETYLLARKSKCALPAEPRYPNMIFRVTIDAFLYL